MIIETIRQAIDNWFHSLVDRRRTSQSIDRLAGGICFGEQILSSLNLDVDMGRRIANRAEKGTGLLAGQSRLEHSREQSRPPVVKDGI